MSVDTDTCVWHEYAHLREVSEPHNLKAILEIDFVIEFFTKYF